VLKRRRVVADCAALCGTDILPGTRPPHAVHLLAWIGDGDRLLDGGRIHHPPAPEQFKLHEDLKKYLYDKGKGYQAQWAETGEILYVRGLINAMLGVEAIRTAQEKFGKKPLTGEQVRWGLENLNLTAERFKELGFENELQPIKISCADHEGTRTGRIQTWDGKKWNIASDWITADDSIIAPMVKEAAAKYAAEKNITTGCLMTN
jgi:branched-chain amino acid transport system substrate-binding protein